MTAALMLLLRPLARPPHTVWLLVVGIAITVTGCGGGPGKVVLVEGAARTAAAQQAKVVAIRPTLAKFSARSELLARTAKPKPIDLRPEIAAADAVEASAPMREAAEGSAARIRTIASDTTRERTGREQVIACARGGALTAARHYTTNYVRGEPPPRVDVTIVKSVGACLKKAFPGQAAAVHHVTEATTRSILAYTEQVSDTRATAQDYADWLVYSASLYEQQGAPMPDTRTAATPSAVSRSADDLLGMVFLARQGRAAVRHEEWARASRNRTLVLEELDALQVTGELEDAHRILVAAMRTSLASDRRHAACGRCAAPYDRRATRLKKAFAREFNPYIEPRYGDGIEHSEF